MAQYWIRRFAEIALKFKIYRIYTYIRSAHRIGNDFMHIFHACIIEVSRDCVFTLFAHSPFQFLGWSFQFDSGIKVHRKIVCSETEWKKNYGVFYERMWAIDFDSNFKWNARIWEQMFQNYCRIFPYNIFFYSRFCFCCSLVVFVANRHTLLLIWISL